ncbi:hypothetical protein pEaSNUABM34_00227 [Erwinia phage pEa_SNUABM_34]|nr:hypothetical protein pEaSNUABM34_00227 [Erwinia phage pEa_SNUABM_34]QYW05241.1 hypothetical protein pEaSNUABM21_00227 [Erwinia phage pEa_SNUABM_21]QYW05583.1 hypothetical protein pEaSNUABM25_00227 [Erwinia phage pEa_SNUABM_25]
MALKPRRRFKSHTLADLREREHQTTIRLSYFRYLGNTRIERAIRAEQKNKLL